MNKHLCNIILIIIIIVHTYNKNAETSAIVLSVNQTAFAICMCNNFYSILLHISYTVLTAKINILWTILHDPSPYIQKSVYL